MSIRLYNTKTRTKEVFEPLDPSNVRMYVCGPTVYDRAHIGNARPVVVFDVLYRLLRHKYGADAVTYVRNFTDVDDKINAKSAETGRSIRDITDETIGWYNEDMDALGALRPDHEPRATEYIAQMIAMGEDLIARGHAYVAEGHVLFEARTDPEYGCLSRRPLDEMKAGARVEVAPYKRDPMDSVIWKPSTDDQPGWDSPWGRGRPGWHIECSAMAGDLLGEAFDIHGGGIDLQFPHHENEWAQARCVGHDFATVWMHNGYLMVEGEKMSKSLGNFFTVADLREELWDGAQMRYSMLRTHYRQPLDWTEKALEEAATVLRKWREVVGESDVGQVSPIIIEALSDDLNTPKVISGLNRLAKEGDGSGLNASALFLGIDLKEMTLRRGEKVFGSAEKDSLDSAVAGRIARLVDDRKEAKAIADFAKADEIRNRLAAAGVEVVDKANGPEWSLTSSFDASMLSEVEDV